VGKSGGVIDTETAVRVAVAVAREQGLRVEEPTVLKDSYNVRVHLRPAPVVARVPTVTALARPRPEEVLRRELDIVSFLDERGFPVVPPSPRADPGPHVRDGVAVSFFTHVRIDPERAVTAEDVGRALAGLHEALRSYPGELPVYGPVLDEPARLLDLLEPGLRPHETARLRDEHAALAAALPRAGLRPVHGDAHPGNLLPTEDGLLWNDFEECMAAPAGWDLAVMRDTRQADGRAAVAAYGADPDDPGLEVYRRARRLQAVLWQLAKGLRSPGYMGAGREALREWLRA
jgi:Ser/Thr protein kinase RdoA (MazF antagonist)